VVAAPNFTEHCSHCLANSGKPKDAIVFSASEGAPLQIYPSMGILKSKQHNFSHHLQRHAYDSLLWLAVISMNFTCGTPLL
jgi:hypothetical protein